MEERKRELSKEGTGRKEEVGGLKRWFLNKKNLQDLKEHNQLPRMELISNLVGRNQLFQTYVS